MTALSNAVLADLRRRLEEGEFSPADVDPELLVALAFEYQVGVETVGQALQELGLLKNSLAGAADHAEWEAAEPTLEDLQHRRDALTRAIEVVRSSIAENEQQ